MRKFSSCIVVVCFCMMFAGASLAKGKPHQIVTQPKMAWGMTPESVQLISPGTLDGRTMIYQEQFLEYPAMSEYWFNAQNQLNHISYQPRYTYDDPAAYRPEFQRINGYFQEQYGDPNRIDDTRAVWIAPDTQATVVLYPNGWAVRLDPIQPR